MYWRLDNEKRLLLLPSSFSNTAFTSLAVTNILPGPAIITVVVNGIPSTSQVVFVMIYQYLFLPMILK